MRQTVRLVRQQRDHQGGTDTDRAAVKKMGLLFQKCICVNFLRKCHETEATRFPRGFVQNDLVFRNFSIFFCILLQFY